MPNTYTQLYIHLVFAVEGRANVLSEAAQDKVYRYASGILEARNHKNLAINGMGDHIHIFFGLNPSLAISDLCRDLKTGTTNFINEKKLVAGKFNWQEGYGAFSHSKSQKDQVIEYVRNQKQHHAKRSFREEYIGLLQKFEIEYDERYLFKWIE